LSRCISSFKAPTPRALDTTLALAPSLASLAGAGGTAELSAGANCEGAQPPAAPTPTTAAIERLCRELDQQLPECDIVPGKRRRGGGQRAVPLRDAGPSASWRPSPRTLLGGRGAAVPFAGLPLLLCRLVSRSALQRSHRRHAAVPGGYLVVRRRVPAALQHGHTRPPVPPHSSQQQPGGAAAAEAWGWGKAGGEGGAAAREGGGGAAPSAQGPAAGAADASSWTPALEQRYQEQLQHLRLVAELRGLLLHRLLVAQQQLLAWAAARAPPPRPAAPAAPPPTGAAAVAPPPLPLQAAGALPPLLPLQAAGALPTLLPQASCPPAPSPSSPHEEQAPGGVAGDTLGGYVRGTVRAGRKLALTWNPVHSRHKALQLLS
jgi:hypothetical protein